MIGLKNIDKWYGDFKAVIDLSLEVEAGELFGFLGPNGAGKTPSIKMITGLLPPDRGQVKINGYDIEKESIKAKRQFGYLPEEINLFENLTGRQYLNFVGDMYEVEGKQRQQRILDMAETFKMAEKLENPISSYSQGMKRKVALMGTLLPEPRVWILDEPLSGLDPKSSFTIKQMMREHVQQGNTVFFSTHVMEVAENLCDRVGIISDGQLIAVDKVSELKKEESLENVFLELTENE